MPPSARRPRRRSPEVAVMTTGQTIAPAGAYQALFDAALPGLPGTRHAPLRASREASFARFRTLGFPGPKAEAWKYTSVRALARETYALSDPAAVDRGDDRPLPAARPAGASPGIRQRPVRGRPVRRPVCRTRRRGPLARRGARWRLGDARGMRPRGRRRARLQRAQRRLRGRRRPDPPGAGRPPGRAGAVAVRELRRGISRR